MNRTCLRCGHLNADASGAADEACPVCGAVYRKVEAFVRENGVVALKRRAASLAPVAPLNANASQRPVAAEAQEGSEAGATPFYLRAWFYIPVAFVLGPVIASVTGAQSGLVAMGPFFAALGVAAVLAYSKSQAAAQEKAREKAAAQRGTYVCLSCARSFEEPKMRGSGWIEVVLYVFLAIVGGVIYSIWRRTGQNMECPHCGSRTFRLASEAPAAAALVRGAPAAPDGKRVPCPECHELILEGARKCKHCGSAIGRLSSATEV